jgi:hypothetical protein
MIKLSLWLTHSTYSNDRKRRNKTTTKINVCQLRDRSVQETSPIDKLQTSLLCEHLRSACYSPVINSNTPTCVLLQRSATPFRTATTSKRYSTRRIAPGNTVWTYAGFEGGTSRLVQSLQRSLTIKKSVELACAIVATISPKVKEIWVMLDGWPSK